VHATSTPSCRVGTFVQVYGNPHKRTEPWTPDFIKVRDDWNQKISGLSVIDKVVTTGSEPLFRADGYLIRVTAATSISFNEEVKSRADIAPIHGSVARACGIGPGY
jgi:hypothetical protein